MIGRARASEEFKSINENVMRSSNNGQNAIFEMMQEHACDDEEPEDDVKVQEENPANTAVNAAKEGPLNDAIAKIKTHDDDYKESHARNLIFEKTDQNAFDEKLLEKNEALNLFSEDY